MSNSEENYLQHYGILRKSGRYPWGSGSNANTELARAYGFIGYIEEMRAKGLTDVQICEGISTKEYPFTTTDLRATRTMARNAVKAADIATAERYKAKGYSNVEIGKKFNPPKNESTVRALLAPGAKDKVDRLTATADMLKAEVASKGMIEVGKGTNFYIKTGVADNHLQTAVAMLKSEGYVVHNVQVPNLSSPGNKTLMKVLAPEGTTYKDIVSNLGQVKSIVPYSDDNGRSFSQIQPPINISSKRLKINYEEDGGGQADGVVYVRPGKKELDLGASNYAQVRIQIDGTHFIKGMAIYKDDLPDGVDLVFNTNKRKADLGDDKLKALKPLKRLKAEGDDPKNPGKWTGPIDEENPFGSIVRQIGERDTDGRITKVTSAMNLVNEAGDWDKWSNTLSSQMLSKQKPSLIKERLDETFESKRQGLDEILALTNPAVKKKLLESYADDLDAAAVHLKAKGLPRQETKVILPMNSMKPTEIYAPTFNNGESVVLIRYPHGGKFEIPELTVNNNHRPAKSIIGQATDAVGINSKVAERLSGADFDGDTVVVIPNPKRKIQSEPPLQELVGFNPQVTYKGYDGMPKLTPQYKGKLMGDVSNLITDMTIRGAANHEIAQAVKHSMVVIDAEKHNLNWRQSAIDNNIASLKKKYQGKDGPGTGKYNSGASTLISQAKSPMRVPERKLQKASQGGSIDPVTGKKIYRETGVTYPNKKDPNGPPVVKKMKVKKLEYVDDAHSLSSGTVQEKLYADHSNRLKALANETRLHMLKTGNLPHSESAGRVYAKNVAQLKSRLNEALKNAPRERQAQVLANAKVQAYRDANPDMDKAERKKLESLALNEARARVGAKKKPVLIEDEDWEAIQAGALRPTVLKAILDNADPKRVKELATPREKAFVSTAQIQKAQRLLGSGATQAQAAAALGISVTTLKKYLSGGG